MTLFWEFLCRCLCRSHETMGMVREERELKGQVLGFPLLGGKLVLLTTLLTDTKYASFSHINNQFSHSPDTN